jgi:hypothetical protein
MDPLIMYFNARIKRHRDRQRVQLRKKIQALLLMNHHQLVGQSFCLKHDIMRLDDCDDLCFQFVSVQPNRSQRRKARSKGIILVYLQEYTPLNALCYLLSKDSYLSLIVMFNEALHKRIITIEEIDVKLQMTFKGCIKLRDIRPYLTDKYESGFENLFAIKVEILGYRPFGYQLAIGKVRADFYYRNLLIELDGREKLRGKYNRTPLEQFEHETFKSNLYQLEGYDIIRLFWEDLGNGNLEYILIWAKIPKKRRNRRLRRLIRKDVGKY